MTFYHDIEKFLSETFGFDPESIGRKSIRDAVNLRMSISMVDGEVSYLKLIKDNADEAERLVEQIVVPETWFFRDKESFNFLKKHIDEMMGITHEGKALRILSVPCSTGEEPYSIAMVLLEAGLSAEQFRIDAADISRKAIEAAKRAIYGKGSFRGENSVYQDRYFEYTGEGFRLDQTVAGLVHFFNDNFIQPYALRNHEPYHAVFCKNLLIYLNNNARKMVLANIDNLLLPKGIVFTGHSEMMSLLQYGFKPVKHSRSFACRKDVKAEVNQAERVHGSLSGRKEMNIRQENNGHARRYLEEPKAENSIKSHLKETGAENLTRTSPDFVLSRVRKLADRGSLEEALNLCGQYLKECSGNKEAYYLMGLINLAMNYFTEAEDFFQKALYLDPCYYEALLHMSLLYQKRGEQSKASVISERIKRANSEQ
jgi:chemotaxis protein methyltransferase WspC